MKSRRIKSRMREEIHYATHQARTREMGDVRRWKWMAESPWTERLSVDKGIEWTGRWDPVFGRVYSAPDGYWSQFAEVET